MAQARRAFASGAKVVVTERPEGPERVVWSTTTTNDRDSGTWEELAAQVRMWRSRYPRQSFYVLDVAEVGS